MSVGYLQKDAPSPSNRKILKYIAEVEGERGGGGGAGCGRRGTVPGQEGRGGEGPVERAEVRDRGEGGSGRQGQNLNVVEELTFCFPHVEVGNR